MTRATPPSTALRPAAVLVGELEVPGWAEQAASANAAARIRVTGFQ